MDFSCYDIASAFVHAKQRQEILSELSRRGFDKGLSNSLVDEWFAGEFNKMPNSEYAKTGGEISNITAFTARLEKLYPNGFSVDKPWKNDPWKNDHSCG